MQALFLTIFNVRLLIVHSTASIIISKQVPHPSMAGEEHRIEVQRDHLFISYASEQGYFIDWLCSKLIADGFNVWCDRIKLLGGESYPRDIDVAIKRAFRVIAILSEQSIVKPLPSKERTIALRMGEELRVADFLVPINFDGLSPTQLDWMTSDITFIPFNHGWAQGYSGLIKKLESIQTPRKSTEMCSFSHLPDEKTYLVEEMEPVFSNILRVESIPRYVNVFETSQPTTFSGTRHWLKKWPFYWVSKYCVLSFMSPPDDILNECPMDGSQKIEWVNVSSIKGIPIHTVISNLLENSISLKCWERGLVGIEQKRASFYFPFSGDKAENKVHLIDFNGIKTWRAVCGQRKIRLRTGEITNYLWSLSPTFRVRGGRTLGYYVIINLSAFVTNGDGSPIQGRGQNSRSKKVTKYWWNPNLLNYQLAIVQLLTGDDDRIIIGNLPEEQIQISPRLEQYTMPVHIIEEKAAPQGDEETDGKQIDEETDDDSMEGEDSSG
ncbi:MAG: hypothetical protein A4E32_02171 [Methanomassiliicoccales archaeon PtaU1.Bin124]|nr:MAG: hypothetical protein A4E32_02171 [Methanomassiliicoccales archaeon PtaU1.Bin124]